jgi:hypothetical protein
MPNYADLKCKLCNGLMGSVNTPTLLACSICNQYFFNTRELIEYVGFSNHWINYHMTSGRFGAFVDGKLIYNENILELTSELAQKWLTKLKLYQILQ